MSVKQLLNEEEVFILAPCRVSYPGDHRILSCRDAVKEIRFLSLFPRGRFMTGKVANEKKRNERDSITLNECLHEGEREKEKEDKMS